MSAYRPYRAYQSHSQVDEAVVVALEEALDQLVSKLSLTPISKTSAEKESVLERPNVVVLDCS